MTLVTATDRGTTDVYSATFVKPKAIDPATKMPSRGSGNCAATWTNTNIFYTVVDLLGNIVQGQTQANPVVSTTQNGPTVTALPNNFLLAYGNSTAPGIYDIPVVPINAKGVAGVLKLFAHSSSNVLTNPLSTTLTNGNAYLTYADANGLYGGEVDSTAATVGTVQTINQSPSGSLGNPVPTGVANNNAIVVYSNGISNPQILGRSILAGTPTGSEIVIANGTYPSIAGSTDGTTALVVLEGPTNLNGILLSSTGTPQSNLFNLASGLGPLVAPLPGNEFFATYGTGIGQQFNGFKVSFSGGTTSGPTSSSTTGSPTSSTTGSPTSSTTGSPTSSTTGTPPPTTSVGARLEPSSFLLTLPILSVGYTFFQNLLGRK